jgi:RimJ/RimL family protein N-acetyltransferase
VVSLRPADLSDEARLLEWRNEPATRAASLMPGEISAADHHAWLVRRLADDGSALFIVLDDLEPVGQVRLDRRGDGLAEVSIGLAPEARGRGVGREALRLAALEAPRVEATTLSALVKADNEASLRSFAAAGYREFGRRDDVVELRLTLDQDTGTR